MIAASSSPELGVPAWTAFPLWWCWGSSTQTCAWLSVEGLLMTGAPFVAPECGGRKNRVLSAFGAVPERLTM